MGHHFLLKNFLVVDLGVVGHLSVVGFLAACLTDCGCGLPRHALAGRARAFVVKHNGLVRLGSPLSCKTRGRESVHASKA